MSSDGRGDRPAGPPQWAAGVSLGRIFGIPVFIAPSWFVIALLFIVVIGGQLHQAVPSYGGGAYGIAALVVVLLYGSVLLHELTHSVVARALGLPVRRIVLQLLGGVSEITVEPATPAQESAVALAGPLMSVLLAGIGAAVAAALPGAQQTLSFGDISVGDSLGRTLVNLFAYINLVVAIFNLLPGLPLDGGRVLRAGLWGITRNKVTATRAAAFTGRGIAVALAAYAVFDAESGGSFSYRFVYLIILAVFMWQSATQQMAQARLSSVLPNLVARQLTRRALPVTADLPLAEAVRRAHATSARALVVVDSTGAPDGLVSEAAVAAVPDERRPWVAVGSLARHVDPALVLRADLSGEELIAALRAAPASEYLVVEQSGQIYGVLAQADVMAALRA